MKSPDNQSPPVVFVVDDDSAVRESLDSLIRSIGLRVETFSSAQEFLRHKLPDAPACLILDYSHARPKRAGSPAGACRERENHPDYPRGSFCRGDLDGFRSDKASETHDEFRSARFV